VSRSFRVQLAARFTAAMAAAVAAIGVASVLTLGAILDRELNASILSVASIQAASVTDSPSGEMRFHEWALTPDEAASVRDLMRYTQVWSEAGQSLLRSQFMSRDLPLSRGALAEASAGELVWREQDFLGTPVRSLYYPLSRFGAAHERHVLQVAAPLVARHEMVRRLALFFAGVVCVVALTSFGGSWWLAGRAVRPVHEIIDQAEAIGAGSLGRRISAYADTREYRRLVEVLNTMLGRIQRAFETQRRFTSDASHELRSPLTVIRGELELALRRERTSDEYRTVLASSLEEVVRLSRITEDLLTLARSDAGMLPAEPESVELDEVAGRIVERLQGTAEARGVSLSLSVTGARTVTVDPGLLGQLIWNLADNALRYTPRGGRVEVGLAASDDELHLEVVDTGPGLGDDPERLFERFYRPEGVRTPGEATSGTGLGLAIVRAIAEDYGGRVEAGNRPEAGARVAVILPL
jgi:two-component system OmpR family sensor kinase